MARLHKITNNQKLNRIDQKYEAKDYQPKVDRFIKGYESVTPISAEEKRLIPMLGVSLYFFYLGVQCQRYDNWSNSFLSENYLKRFINGLVKRYYDIYKLGDNTENLRIQFDDFNAPKPV